MNFKVGMAQLALKCNDIESNIVELERWFQKASLEKCDLLIFPEVHLNYFFPQYPQRQDMCTALNIDDEAIQQICNYAKKYNINCIPNIYLEENKKNYDASIVINNKGDILGISKMMHIAQQDQFFEQDYYTPSNTGYKVYDIDGCKVGIIICFDRHYSESYKACASQGSDIVIIPTANTKAEPLDIFEAEIRTAAFQNNIGIAMVNRVGIEDKMHFCGESLAVMSQGQVIAKGSDQEEFIVANFDITAIRSDKALSPYHAINRFKTTYA